MRSRLRSGVRAMLTPRSLRSNYVVLERWRTLEISYDHAIYCFFRNFIGRMDRVRSCLDLEVTRNMAQAADVQVEYGA